MKSRRPRTNQDDKLIAKISRRMNLAQFTKPQLHSDGDKITTYQQTE